MSYVAGQQAHEIGLRMALGAQRRDVLKLVFGEAAMMVFAGLPIGLIAAGLLTELIKSLLFGISTTDPVTFAAVAILDRKSTRLYSSHGYISSAVFCF